MFCFIDVQFLLHAFYTFIQKFNTLKIRDVKIAEKHIFKSFFAIFCEGFKVLFIWMIERFINLFLSPLPQTLKLDLIHKVFNIEKTRIKMIFKMITIILNHHLIWYIKKS